MKIKIIAVGKLSDNDGINKIINEYEKRLSWKLDIFSLDKKSIKEEEARLINTKLTDNSFKFILSEEGKQFTSTEFAKFFENNQKIDFVIGGAEGLADSMKKQGDIIMSLSKMTLPHMFARMFLVEQIYRAAMILQNHPYHK